MGHTSLRRLQWARRDYLFFFTEETTGFFRQFIFLKPSDVLYARDDFLLFVQITFIDATLSMIIIIINEFTNGRTISLIA